MKRTVRFLIAPVAVSVVAALLVVAGTRVRADAPNLVINPSVEDSTNGQPNCFTFYGWGTNTLATGYLTDAAQSHTGTHALLETISGYQSGDYKAMQTQSPSCAPNVIPGHVYAASVYYQTAFIGAALTAFSYSAASGWQYWTELKPGLPAAPSYAQAAANTPPIPAGVTQITFGVSLPGNGTLTTDDYSLNDMTPSSPTSAPATTTPSGSGTCTGTATQCAKGQWTVLTFPNHVRSIHTVVLSNGKILFMAGSGNDPTVMTNFKSTVWDPRTNVWTDIDTPDDVFCSGHVQLPDGNVLILGGNKAYPVPGGHGYEGLKASYIFNITTMTYQQVNDLNTGHWYPSATELGNGNIFSMGGLDENGDGTVTNEEWNNATQQWLPYWQVPQQWNYFGLYPANILTADGKLFYSGSHVFGNQGNPNGPGAYLIDLAANTLTEVTGLQDINERDQSAAVLLPPAQNQTVMVMGGGNVDTNADANRDTDLIDLDISDPTYHAGPLLPQGLVEMGDSANMQMTDPSVTPETGTKGKMYVSAVILPDRTVLETGGGLNNRANPVYEASNYDPQSNVFTPMAADPVERMYHSESVLYQDGTVISAGSNPGDGSFDMRISIYQPPYLFRSGRPDPQCAGD